MNQHKKTLGQIAYEQSELEFDPIDREAWEDCGNVEQEHWEAIANVVSSEVLYRIEEGLKLL